jgi:GcrA cell cycle regulator
MGNSRGRQLVDLRRHHCRYPFGDPKAPDFHFCGAPIARGPYCAEHYALCYRPYVPKLARPKSINAEIIRDTVRADTA